MYVILQEVEAVDHKPLDIDKSLFRFIKEHNNLHHVPLIGLHPTIASYIRSIKDNKGLIKTIKHTDAKDHDESKVRSHTKKPVRSLLIMYDNYDSYWIDWLILGSKLDLKTMVKHIIAFSSKDRLIATFVYTENKEAYALDSKIFTDKVLVKDGTVFFMTHNEALRKFKKWIGNE